MLAEHLKQRDAAGAWKYLAEKIMKEGKEAARQELRAVVCELYWWQAGEFFALEGAMSWGPGFSSWEDDTLLPPPTTNPVRELRNFIEHLASLPVSSAVQNLITSKKDLTSGSLESRMLRFLFKQFKNRPQEIPLFLYNRIATARSEYELGAARPFLKQWMEGGSIELASVGMVLIICRGLTRVQVKAEAIKMARFGRGQSLYLYSECPDYEKVESVVS